MVPAAVGEEVVYRGFIQTRIAQMFGGSAAAWAIAIVAQAAIFIVTHAYQDVTGMIQVFCYALAAGALYVACGRSLWPLILAHGLVDTVVMTDFYLGRAITAAITP